MPIYEFYCSDCHTIFNFLSRKPSSRRPDCPRCGKRGLERRASSFAISRRLEGSRDEGMPDMDEERMERALTEMAGEAEGMSDDDPRQMARLMRKLFDSTGMPVGAGMEEAIRRMEAGEDPDRIEEELGDQLEGEDSLFGGAETPAGKLKALERKLRAPSVDETLHEL